MTLHDPDNPEGNRDGPFVDRGNELAAFGNSLVLHRARIDGDLIDTRVLKNVLTFYGEGGVGKTELSTQLGYWVVGDTAPSHWGNRPDVSVDAVVRWDVNDSRGGLDPIVLLTALRTQLGAIERTWPAFDLAFSALHRSVRPGVELTFRTPRRGLTTLSEVVSGLTSDAASLAGVAAAGGAGAAAVGLGRGLLATAHARSVARRTFRAYPGLEDLIAACEAASGSNEDTADLAGRVAFMLSRQIALIDPPTDRPMVVVFVDHMERLQLPGERHLGEAALIRLVARLPFFLFVVTGRNSLRWHEPGINLPSAGPDVWPNLSVNVPPLDEPRQHRIGNLSIDDAVEFLRASFERESIDVGPELTHSIARETDGWPLHLHTILDVARERSRSGRELTLEDLGGSFPDLVERLLSDLPADVADAFRAACLLPYFDIEFVAAAGELPSGSVERMLRRQLVQPNPGSGYPYRIHDRLRELVRQAGSRMQGGWGTADWDRHARLALGEAKRRFDRAQVDADDAAAIESLALGLNVATENGVFDEWLVRAIRSSPSIVELSPRVSATPTPTTPMDLADTLDFLHALARREQEDITDSLALVADRGGPIASTAGLWRAYELRRRGSTAEAVHQLEALIRDFGDRPSLYSMQIVTTLRLARRFSDAMDRMDGLTDRQQSAQRAAIGRRHGRYDGSTVQFEDRVRRAASRRFQIELMGDWLTIRHREHGVTEQDAFEVIELATPVRHLPATVAALSTLAQIRLFDEDGFNEALAALEEVSARRWQDPSALPTTLALRAWAIGDESLASRAYDIASQANRSNSSWIGLELLLEHLSYPLENVETQWLEPYEEVRDRWLAVFKRIIERAKAPTEDVSS